MILCQTCGNRKHKCARCARISMEVRHAGYTDPLVLVPEPPVLDLQPRSNRAIVTVVVGEEAEKCYQTSGPYMRQYAQRMGADFHVLHWPGHPDWPMSAKFAIARVLDFYPQIAYFDADVLLRPNCVDVFELAGDADWAACDERANHMGSEYGQGIMARYQLFRKQFGFRRQPVSFYFNCGVQVVRRAAQSVLLPPEFALPANHCAEQDYVNAMVMDRGVKFRCLDRRANWQNWQDPGFMSAPDDAILHWSGAVLERSSRGENMAYMARMYGHTAWCPPPCLFPEMHTWYADERHVRWIRDELALRKPRRVLEIGSHHGYSTCAFLEALVARQIDEFHICEVEPTPELNRVLDYYGVDVTIHPEKSVELLARDSNWDFVFVDGAHEYNNVVKEAKLLLKCPAVFAHDTYMDGPAELARMFRAAGYTCVEDKAKRPGERTERGMFFAYME